MHDFISECPLHVDQKCKQNQQNMSNFNNKYIVRGSPDSTVFAPPGNRTIEKTVLFGD